MVARFLRFPPPLNALASLVLLITLTSSGIFAADGAKIFKQNCATCHTLTDAKLTGPGLAGVMGRIPQDPAWFKNWIKSSSTMIASGDPYAVKIYGEYKTTMTAFGGVLSDEEIEAVIEFVKNPTTGPGEVKKELVIDDGDAVQDGPNIFLLFSIASGLLLLLFGLRSAKRNLQNTVNKNKGLDPLPEYSFKEWMMNNKRTVALIIIVLLNIGAKWSWDAMMGIGVYQGYKPKQPIEFNHAVHTQQNGINCEYCHSGASKSKVAGVPSASVCMNCHKAVASGPRTGETEIAKIYAAVGWNPKTQKYENPPQPIEWVKVHNLPDFVFFSHQQHVNVGKQECKTCHGDVEKMTVARQVQPLTMGWCIDCHRTTAVPGMSDNPYYEDLHKKLAEKYKGQPITVEKMGGIECAKCHY